MDELTIPTKEQKILSHEHTFWEATDAELIAISEHTNNELLRFNNPDLIRIRDLLLNHTFDDFLRASLEINSDLFLEKQVRANVIKKGIVEAFNPALGGDQDELKRIRTRAFIAFKMYVIDLLNKASFYKDPGGKELSVNQLQLAVRKVKEIRKDYLIAKKKVQGYLSDNEDAERKAVCNR